MRREGEYFSIRLDARAGDRYFLIADENKPVADPVSRLLPEGPHGPTEIVDPEAFKWSDGGWHGVEYRDLIIYELHLGTFTSEGTFDAAIEKLAYLKDTLGVTAIELMPVGCVPRESSGAEHPVRNWGYDGISPYSVEAAYGGPEGLKRFVDAAHRVGLAVVMDVVYNHLGNEGNYTRFFAPYFTPKHQTPWGEAINYDDSYSHGVREWVVENAKFWVREYHVDALRLDAVQTIHDDSARHILADIAEGVHQLAGELGRKVWVIAESDENDSRLVRQYGLHGFWSDDFHHAVHAFLTGERAGYYQDFGEPENILTALNEGYVYQGDTFKFWNGRARGTPARDVPIPANLICLQNHDQVGNRAKGERLTHLVSTAQRRAAAALLLLSPETPLLFMGEEFDSQSPFQFFTSYSDSALVDAVRAGRREEFKQFGAFEGEVPDPQEPATFLRSKLDWEALEDNAALKWYAALIALRKRFVCGAERTCRAELHNGEISLEVPAKQPRVKVVASLESPQRFEDETGWERVLSAEDERASVAVYVLG